MAVSKAITKCVPYVNSSSKVDKWDIEMTYKNNNEGDSTYYTSTFNITVPQLDDDGNANLVAICPVSHWDTVFASQVDSVITNPPSASTPDQAFNVPS